MASRYGGMDADAHSSYTLAACAYLPGDTRHDEGAGTFNTGFLKLACHCDFTYARRISCFSVDLGRFRTFDIFPFLYTRFGTFLICAYHYEKADACWPFNTNVLQSTHIDALPLLEVLTRQRFFF